MRRRQKTIRTEGSFSGTGLHTGQNCVVIFRPAPEDSGIVFFKQSRSLGRLDADLLVETERCSGIGDPKDPILTVEHLLAALSGLGITNIEVDVRGGEIPGLDGSALEFVNYFKTLGVVEQKKEVHFYRVREPIFCFDKQKAISIVPSDTFSVSYLLDYDHPHLRGQKADFDGAKGDFEKEIAPARTFCTESEARELQSKGLGLGASRENTLVIHDDGSHRGGMRFDNECARHKVLDIFGDLELLGTPVLGHVTAIRSGHGLNRRLVRAMKKQREVSHADGR